MNDLEQLKRLCPRPASRSGQAPPAWDSVEQGLGTRLPDDYKRLFEEYGPGSFYDFLSLYQPQAYLETIDIEVQTPKIIASLEKRREWTGYSLPYPIASLQPVAVTGNGEYVFWVAEPEINPNLWKIAINEASGDDWFAFDGTITAFLRKLCEGALDVPLFPDSLLESPPSFHPASYTPEDRRRAHAINTAPATGPINSEDIREWARRQGYDVAPRGRIPGAVLDAYEQAHRAE
ncbi:histone-like nucleoid-structuring protein Lsr2 [Streptomyces sp. NPDC053427]|uniref:Lsr2 family DNA-binding protein n=1 Tax=Streptomyces sp. NPDC053427 TaxID=3365701 RepID=UPI0037CD8916